MVDEPFRDFMNDTLKYEGQKLCDFLNAFVHDVHVNNIVHKSLLY